MRLRWSRDPAVRDGMLSHRCDSVVREPQRCTGRSVAQQSLNAGLQAAQNSTALLLEEAARVNGAAVRQAFQEGVARMEQTLAAARRIAWLSLTASIVAFTAAICAIFVRVIH